MTHTASDQMVERLIERDADTTVGLAGDGVKGFSTRRFAPAKTAAASPTSVTRRSRFTVC